MSDADNRETRSIPLRNSTRGSVSFIDVDRLSPCDYGPSHDTSGKYSTYESDPPWEQIRASLPDALLPPVTFFRTKELPPPPPPPATETDLLRNLVRSITASPPASLSQALSYHAAHSRLHSTASFNVVIRYAIRCASFGSVVDLLAQMVREDVPGDEDTRALRVRSMVRSGLWNLAWREEMTEAKEAEMGLPLAVWLEFFGSVKRGAILGRKSYYGRPEGNKPKPLQTPDPTVTSARFHALLQHPPMVSVDEWQRVPPRVTHALVRSLIEQDRRATAMEFTRTYFQSLPREIDGEWRRACLAIIHLHMTSGRVCNLSAHFAALKTLFGLLDMHHSFQPTATTLFLLLRTLKQTKRSGERADKLVLSFQRRWSAAIVDDRVRRRWASLWLKQGRADRAEVILESQHALDVQRVAWEAERDVIGTESHKGRSRRMRWLELHRGTRRGKERWRWRRLRRRWWRKEVRHPRQSPDVQD